MIRADQDWPLANGEMAERIRTSDWGATPLGPCTGWPSSLRSTVDLLLTHGFAMIVLWGPDLIQIYNDRYSTLMGRKHPAGLGQPTRECWPEVWHINAPIYERVLADETVTVDDGLYPVARGGAIENLWLTLTYSPVRDEDGHTAGVLVTIVETTARVQAEDRLRSSEERFRAFVTASSDVVYRMSPDWSEMRQLDGQGFLASTSQPSETWMEHYIHPDDQPSVQAAIVDAIQRKALFELEHRVRRADGTLGWTLSRAVPIFDGQGSIIEWLGAATDITGRFQASKALRESEERYRAIVERARDYAIFTMNPDGRITSWSPGAEQVFGWTAEEVIGRPAEMTYVPEDVASGRPGTERQTALSEGQAPNICWHLRKDGSRVFIEGVALALRDEGGSIRGFLKIGQDVTERRQTADQMIVLVAELQHRTRNLIAVVRSIAQQTINACSGFDEFREAFNERLAALSRVQGLLSRADQAHITIETLLRTELDALGGGQMGARVSLRGPDVALRSSVVQTLALALHELATNACKYGALANDVGRLDVTWALYPDAGERRRLVLTWAESDVDMQRETNSPVGQPGGYGRELIERALPYALGAETTYEMAQGGIRCTIDLPLDKRRSRAS